MGQRRRVMAGPQYTGMPQRPNRQLSFSLLGGGFRHPAPTALHGTCHPILWLAIYFRSFDFSFPVHGVPMCVAAPSSREMAFCLLMLMLKWGRQKSAQQHEADNETGDDLAIAGHAAIG